MKQHLLFLSLLLISIYINSAHCQVIISQYYEGSSNDKFIEITNLGPSSVNLSSPQLYLCLFSNAAADNPSGVAPTNSQTLSGTLNSGSTLIFKNSSAVTPNYALTATASAICNFNGDDLVVLSTSNTTTSWANRIDVVGNGNSWGVDKSFYRRSDQLNTNSSFTISEWVEKNLSEIANANSNNSEYLGFHKYHFSYSNSGDWETTSNWNKNSLPSATDSAIINGSVSINSIVSVQNIKINPTFSIRVKPTFSITISTLLTNNAGASGLVIESDATGTGSLIHSTAGVAATVERYIPGVSYAWHLLGAPVAAQGISGDWIAGNYDFYSWDEAQALWLNQKVVANNITSFTAGKGYLVAYETAALTKSFSGNLNNGDVVVAVTKDGAGGSNGANLLANPYPSGIDWFTATKTLFADNFAYVYDQTANGGAGAFVSIDGSANNAWIAPHQGFFVVAQTAGNFTFTNAMREHGGTYTKNTTGIEDELAIRLSGETWFDVSRIRIREGSTSQRDRNDALHFSSFTADAPQLYTLSEDGKQLSINALPAISQETAISLGTITPIEGAYSISVETLNGQFADKTIYLEDKLLNVQHNLTSNGAYSFIGTPADSPTRFLLHFGAVGVSEQPESSALKAYVVGGQLYFPLQGEATLQIVDLQGRVLQQSHVAGQGLTSTAMQQPAGAYVVRLVGSHSVQTAKVIVK